MDITKACTQCGKEFVIEFEYEDFVKWQNGAMIQDAFPYLTPAEREFAFLTGICGECFDNLFPVC